QRLLAGHTQRNSDVALGVGVDQQGRVLALGETRRQVHCCRSFTGAALLIENRDAARALRSEPLLAEARLAALERAEVTLLTVRGHGDLEYKRGSEQLPARAARLLHALIEAAWGAMG